ncbi:hypothetical protein [Piscinibacter sp. XHJ-5]|uniref:tetratricopeptide repeat protein n=1 Tax=Piscinibacter sp. XHJ-5 TaxID=3037797 RepID=UPI002452D462|nr:hypothetical protein [Piscinibacter sp. XHJ-5]
MRRQDIQLLASARQGDAAARCEVGRRYLLGIDGFPRHIATGIEHLSHASVRDLPAAARIVAEHLALDDLLELQQERPLSQAAQAGSTVAQLKLGAWECARRARAADGLHWLKSAAAGGDEGARRALSHATRGQPDAEPSALELLRALRDNAGIDTAAIALIAARRAHAGDRFEDFIACLQTALALAGGLSGELMELVAAAVRQAREQGRRLQGIEAEHLRASLEQRANQGDRDAAYVLGLGLCGVADDTLGSAVFADSINIRRGAAYLLRAADAGRDEAWLHLYRLHADHRLSVSNPQMARFFLEKAATRGQSQAQRKLGALMLRESSSLAESELAIHWLHQAASHGDAHAAELLSSLVLPVDGRAEDALPAIEQIRRSDPWLAVRLQLSRTFGLTKLEALCVDPAAGLRPWGLVVGKNPFISQSRLSAPRAIPATSEGALVIAREAASFFGQARRDTLAIEGDLRRRSLRQRRAFERLGLDEAMFFATASSTTLESLRLGPKWAFRAKQPLRMALAA